MVLLHEICHYSLTLLLVLLTFAVLNASDDIGFNLTLKNCQDAFPMLRDYRNEMELPSHSLIGNGLSFFIQRNCKGMEAPTPQYC